MPCSVYSYIRKGALMMTLGQRIQALRKQRGMSQEALGEVLDVSRQAVSKWEGDNGIPELDTLIAMSRLFGVTVGQLLGVEDPASEKSETVNEPENTETDDNMEDQVESVLRRYVEQTTRTDERARFVRRGGILFAALVLTAVFIVLFAKLGSLRNTVRLLRSDLSNLQVYVSDNHNNLSGQIRSTIYDVLSEKANLLSTYEWKPVDFDFDNQTVTLCLNATLKEYISGSRLQFCADWMMIDGTEGKTSGDWADGPAFQSEITIPLNTKTVISIRVEDAEGNIKEQVVEPPIYQLHPDYFHLWADHLTVPFAITITKGFGIASSSAKAEQAYIHILSQFPDLIWPEKAELTAFVNRVEVMNEIMTVTSSEGEKQIFNASIQDTYCDLTLKEGDKLEIVLEVTDNYGRTEQYSYSNRVKDGRLQPMPAEKPAIMIGN